MLEDHAEEVGVVERNRKLQMPALVWSLVFGFATGESRSLADFRRSYNSTADDTLCPSGFYQQLTPELAEYLSDLGVEQFRAGVGEQCVVVLPAGEVPLDISGGHRRPLDVDPVDRALAALHQSSSAISMTHKTHTRS